MDVVAPFAMFAVFVAIFWWQARRHGMSMREWFDARQREAGPLPPGWWRPMAILVTVMIAGFLVYLTAKQGWRWAYLWVIPLLGGFFAISVPIVSWVARVNYRRARDR